jgi:hypothetical protein
MERRIDGVPSSEERDREDHMLVFMSSEVKVEDVVNLFFGTFLVTRHQDFEIFSTYRRVLVSIVSRGGLSYFRVSSKSLSVDFQVSQSEKRSENL